MTSEQIGRDEIKRHFEANMLDGNAVQIGQMLAATEVLEYVIDVAAQIRTAVIWEADAKAREDVAAKLHKFADQPKGITRKDIHDFARSLTPPKEGATTS